MTEFPITVDASPDPAGIVTVGSNLWFCVTETTTTGSLIAEIPQSSPAQFTEIAVPTSGAQARGIAVGPDGRIWFAESNTGKLVALSP